MISFMISVMPPKIGVLVHLAVAAVHLDAAADDPVAQFGVPSFDVGSWFARHILDRGGIRMAYVPSGWDHDSGAGRAADIGRPGRQDAGLGTGTAPAGAADDASLASAAICDRRSSGLWPVSTMDRKDGDTPARPATST
jgi:hypothetical protein